MPHSPDGVLPRGCSVCSFYHWSDERPGNLATQSTRRTLSSGHRPLFLDLQDGGVVVQDGQNDLVHVLPQTEVDVLLLLYGLYELGSHGGKEGEQVSALRSRCGFVTLVLISGTL